MTASRAGAVDGARPRPVLRVASYNLRDLLGDRAAAVRVVRAIAPDVLCLQEVPRRLTTELRLPGFAHECGLWWAGGRRGSGGTAVLTALRVRVRATSSRRLGVRFPDRTRGYAVLDVELPGAAPVTVHSVHLGLRGPERERHAAQIAQGLGPRSVVAGDLNEEPGGPAWRVLESSCRPVSDDWPTFPSDRPTRALDVILAGVGLREASGRPVRLSAADLAAGSDHRPVWADLRLSEA
ncbi:MAG TPA: endonuclease/exonuclease/phosphatase family protein [Intrasporangium sp.]|uniref:endonuclease/exonuclease/phosphatase family protein n=1 Tax=Intrasporangium sp. TaxID=1925024 RepID=UPI002D7A16F2|nr:endonuclease/exonuclease/phosphatase family protein [Intrasporangium sp.]HET7397439.1 endonuclease/exonuclease/phosphatase family protein [Intrasporangium sp.]